MMASFGWEDPFYENRKVAKNRPAVEPSVIGAIGKHNPFDIELYDFAEKLFEKGPRRSTKRNQREISYSKFGARTWIFQERLAFCRKDRAIFAEQHRVNDMTLNIGPLAACKLGCSSHRQLMRELTKEPAFFHFQQRQRNAIC